MCSLRSECLIDVWLESGGKTGPICDQKDHFLRLHSWVEMDEVGGLKRKLLFLPLFYSRFLVVRDTAVGRSINGILLLISGLFSRSRWLSYNLM